ncbi:Sau3AI family type II restriction endonuclease [Streptococcus suis]|uniref:Sau3AI family type II restriction endonuclease n=1 Tax=Streptococcus suis TaxID=1307 RepID=UPI001478A254|nr:Sau3AI family type II restriction endonuclease [Streptococcus suis]MBY5026439.1 DNA mismatch repair protein MutH [Streptococcus suis]MDY7596665.1 Sau3AI family type II restriction endonuclease [Streptococcus suis]NRG75362.1 DNA mismatch repair protein MutH [Streptococcus suis]QZT16802.1 DNA mismatch repair protein MutH [Streptococcus suis]WNF68951.1 Sau3AI family type II restriction endonuclease [Streptococcus suis]
MEKHLFNYDETDIQSILDYSQHLLDRSLGEIIAEYQVSPYKTYRDFQDGTISEIVDKEISMKSKGQYGNYIEKYFYGYQPNSDSAADFDKVGVELKVTPFKVNKNGTISAKERLVLTILNYMEENLDDFYSTHLWQKCSKILLLFYNGLIPGQTMSDYIIEKVFLYEWFEEDMEVILEDYNRIVEKIKQGKAHELSESDGNYLSTCTKGAGKGKDFRIQPFSDTLAKQRAWELKSSYMTYLINHKIFNQVDQESILATARGEKKSFTQVIADKVLAYKGFSEEELYSRFDVNPRAKGKNSTLVKNILGLTGDLEKTQEFQKANMNLRVIRVDKNGLPKEDSPFKTYQFEELANNDVWEESHPYLEICNKRFLFVIFREVSDKLFVLDGIKFWGFPDRLIPEIQRVWNETRNIIRDRVELKLNGNKVSTNFPQSKLNTILFTKIHAQNTYYEIRPNEFVGKGKLSDTDKLPDGRRITKHSFWIPKKFLKEVLLGEWD